MPLPPPPVRVLLVEDDIDVALGLGAFLGPRGVVLDYAHTARTARSLASKAVFDVVVLDIQLPDGDGVTLCKELKQQGLRSPVLFLTARTQLEDKLRGFDAGAIDYMVKPFAPAELLARIRALAQHLPSGGGMLLCAGEYSLHRHTGLLTRADLSLQLNVTALAIVRRLMEAFPGSVSREDLNAALWGDSPPASDPLRMHIYELRRALSTRFGEPVIETIRGLGYRFGSRREGA